MRRSARSGQDHGFNGLADFDRVTGLCELFWTTTFLKTWIRPPRRAQVHEGAESARRVTGAAHAFALLVLVRGGVPRVRQKLLHAERDAALFGITLSTRASISWPTERRSEGLLTGSRNISAREAAVAPPISTKGRR